MSDPENDFLSQSIKAHAPRYAAPAHLADRIRESLPRKQPSRRWMNKASWFGSGLALAASIALFVLSPSTDDILMQDLVGAHARSLINGHLIDVETSDRHVVKPWFNGKTLLSPPVVDLADQGFPLVGGRLDFVADQTAAALIYRKSAHVINVFLWLAQGADQAPKPLPQRDGYNALAWKHNGVFYAVVSDVAPADLKAFQSAWSVKAAQQ